MKMMRVAAMSIAVGIEIVKIFPFFLSKLESEYWCLSAESHGQIQEDVKIRVELGEGNTCNEPREIFEMTQHPNGLHSTHTQQYTQNTQHPNTHSTQYTQNTRHPIGLNILKTHTAPKWTEYWEEELYNVQSAMFNSQRSVCQAGGGAVVQYAVVQCANCAKFLEKCMSSGEEEEEQLC